MQSRRDGPDAHPPRARRYQSNGHRKIKHKRSSYFNEYEQTWKSKLLFVVNITWMLLGLVGLMVAVLLPVLVPKQKIGQLHWPITALSSRLILLSFFPLIQS